MELSGFSLPIRGGRTGLHLWKTAWRYSEPVVGSLNFWLLVSRSKTFKLTTTSGPSGLPDLRPADPASAGVSIHPVGKDCFRGQVPAADRTFHCRRPSGRRPIA